jgi:AcrR family transcriptional regulator
MARRSDHTRKQIFDMAMAAAERIVETDGFCGLTARNIAGAIGYSPGTLYNIFDGRDDIVLHLNGRVLDRLYNRLVDAPVSGVPNVDIGGLLDRYFDFLHDHPNLWRMLFEHKLSRDRSFPVWYVLKVDRVLGLVSSALEPFFCDEEKNRKAEAARILWASLHGICSLADMGKLNAITNRPVRDMAKELMRLLLAGLDVSRASILR